MKRTAKTIIAASLIALLAACGGGGSGSGAQPVTSVVNPTKVVITEQVTEFTPQMPVYDQTTKLVVDTTKKPSVYEIGEAYRCLMNLVSDESDRQPTSDEHAMIAKLESWYWVRFGMLAQSGEKFDVKASLIQTELEMNMLKSNFSYRNYVGRIMSAVYPAMLVKPETWAEAVDDYFKTADHVLNRG
jgi:hypothetical protein